MGKRFKVACVQLNSGQSVKKNLDHTLKYLTRAVKLNANLILTPEITNIVSLNQKHLLKETYLEKNDPFLKKIKEFAKNNSVWVVLGSIIVKDKNESLYNRSYLISNKGVIISKYDKIHMFDAIISSKEFYKESSIFTAGKKVKIGQTPWGKVGLSICYDMRFPELYRSQVAEGAKIISIPSAFTVTTGKAHWHTLLKARAIESGCYVFAPAQCGQNTPKRKTYGHSLIISPYGKILREKLNGTGIITYKINMDEVDNIRKNMPSYQSKLLKRTIS
ncbi:carbon-nitrogen hydrolase family protein [Pelagibacteraceae bacterium]|nr:carbon-nitrogen hydrolase family protein [Pelagibacteraceae bacterium]